MKKELFGKTGEGEEIFLYTLENAKGIKAKVMNYGAILVNLFVPDRDGNCADIVMGYDRAEDYFANGSFFGAVIGPNANRIANARFTLDGVEYRLAANNGPNNLHSDAEAGVHKRIWEAEEGEESVTFSLRLSDGDMGFPGNKELRVRYTLTEENELRLEYDGSSDKNTPINMTNHSYFNLDGHDAGNMEDHVLTLHAASFTEILPGAIPTGRLMPVEGTPMDFRTPKRIGEEIDEAWEQLQMVGGYDHNWCLDDFNGDVRLIASVTNASGSRCMEVYTDLPGVQFYAGNAIQSHTGKNGALYEKRGAFCLETQYYPDTVNEPDFPSAIFGPHRAYHTVTVFRFK